MAALEQWPREGIPRNPGAWLTTAAKRRAIDTLRRNVRLDRKHAELAYELEAGRSTESPDSDIAMDNDIGDDLLRLMFIACHPVLSPESRLALTLRLLGGLTTEEIARAFLVSEPTIAQRIVRAKKTLSKAKASFEVPYGPERAGRLSAVLEVIYLVFNEGYSATAGDDWVRPSLCGEALRLGRILAELTPDEPEVHGLVALMEIQSSRLRARLGPAGEPVRLLDQNRALWDRLLIQRGLTALRRAEASGGTPGLYALQAAIAACHARASTSWRDRLESDRGAVRNLGADYSVAHRQAESGGCHQHGPRSAGRAGSRRRVGLRSGAGDLPLSANRTRRLSREAWTVGRGTWRVRARGRPHEELTREGALAGASSHVRSGNWERRVTGEGRSLAGGCSGDGRAGRFNVEVIARRGRRRLKFGIVPGRLVRLCSAKGIST